MKSVLYTPAYIYVFAIILALPATWLTVGVAGDDVPGVIGMVVTIVLSGLFVIVLSSVRQRLQSRHDARQASEEDAV